MTTEITRSHLANSHSRTDLDQPAALANGGISLKQRLGQLLSAGNYAAARRILVEARNRTPGDLDIQHGLQLVEDRLIRQYRRVIGPLDRTPETLTWKLWGPTTAEEEQMFRRVDGKRSFSDLIRSTEGDICESYKALASLLARRAIDARAPSESSGDLLETQPAIPSALFARSAEATA